MSKTISANLKAELESGAPIIATCWKIEREDGTILGFTDWPEPFTYDTLLYQSSGGYQRTAIDQKEGLNVDNMDIVGLIDSAAITEDDLMSGRYNNAKIWIFLVSPPNLNWGDMKLDYGTIGKIQVKEATYVAEFRSLTVKLSQKYGNKYSRFCRWILGDTNCGIVIDPEVWQANTVYALNQYVKASVYDARRYVCVVPGTSNSAAGEPTWDTVIDNITVEADGVEWQCLDSYVKEGQVTSVTSKYVFTDTSRTEVDDWFKYGILTWVSGNNIGLSYDVKSSTALGVITTKQQSMKDIYPGDNYTISVGCNHILKMPNDVKGSPYTGDCRIKFRVEDGGNARNFGGEPELPNLDRIAAPAESV